ncbi:MAG: twin-arginine translocation signal domain-containing protein [Gammaproteobacteria bacterium]|nr:twin-arginine translocation signal domain-containing protein [Gammaproteobacteria bacterium]MDH3464364.1 twin-arginine translocation signal domain-containing protein [Gammaproteobacteria bacterium]
MTKKTDDRDTRTIEESSSRRKALKTLAATGAVAGVIPKKWATPVVDAMVLPAHAQTTCAPLGSCTSGMSAVVTAAVVLGGGDLVVVGEADIPPGCRSNPSVSLSCAILGCDGLIVGTDPDGGTYQGSGFGTGDCTGTVGQCLVSCSVQVAAGSHSVVSGDSVTLRFNWGGVCICSGVGTVA